MPEPGDNAANPDPNETATERLLRLARQKLEKVDRPRRRRRPPPPDHSTRIEPTQTGASSSGYSPSFGKAEVLPHSAAHVQAASKEAIRHAPAATPHDDRALLDDALKQTEGHLLPPKQHAPTSSKADQARPRASTSSLHFAMPESETKHQAPAGRSVSLNQQPPQDGEHDSQAMQPMSPNKMDSRAIRNMPPSTANTSSSTLAGVRIPAGSQEIDPSCAGRTPPGIDRSGQTRLVTAKNQMDGSNDGGISRDVSRQQHPIPSHVRRSLGSALISSITPYTTALFLALLILLITGTLIIIVFWFIKSGFVDTANLITSMASSVSATFMWWSQKSSTSQGAQLIPPVYLLHYSETWVPAARVTDSLIAEYAVLIHRAQDRVTIPVLDAEMLQADNHKQEQQLALSLMEGRSQAESLLAELSEDPIQDMPIDRPAWYQDLFSQTPRGKLKSRIDLLSTILRAAQASRVTLLKDIDALRSSFVIRLQSPSCNIHKVLADEKIAIQAHPSEASPIGKPASEGHNVAEHILKYLSQAVDDTDALCKLLRGAHGMQGRQVTNLREEVRFLKSGLRDLAAVMNQIKRGSMTRALAEETERNILATSVAKWLDLTARYYDKNWKEEDSRT